MIKEYITSDGKKLSQQEYLYGEDAEVIIIPEEIIMRKVEELSDHLEELLEHSWNIRDSDRCNAIFKDLQFWQSVNKPN